MKLDFSLTQEERIDFAKNFDNPSNEEKELLANFILWAEDKGKDNKFYIKEEKMLQKQKQYGTISLDELQVEAYKKISAKSSRMKNRPIDYEKEATKPIRELLKTIIYLENKENPDRMDKKLLEELYKEQYYILDDQRHTKHSRYDLQIKNFHEINMSPLDEWGLEVYPNLYSPSFNNFNTYIINKGDKVVDLTNISHLSEIYKNWAEYEVLHPTLEFFEGLTYFSKKKLLVLKTRKANLSQINAAKVVERELGCQINPNYMSTILYKQIIPQLIEKIEHFINAQGETLLKCSCCGKMLPDNKDFYHYSSGKRKRKQCKRCFLGGNS